MARGVHRRRGRAAPGEFFAVDQGERTPVTLRPGFVWDQNLNLGKPAEGPLLSWFTLYYVVNQSGLLRSSSDTSRVKVKRGLPGQVCKFGCLPPNAFNWGEVVMQFFLDHPKKD